MKPRPQASKKKQIRTIFAENIKRCRLERGITQEVLADLAGLHRTYIGSVERGERNISIDNIACISRALGTSPANMLTDPSGTEH